MMAVKGETSDDSADTDLNIFDVEQAPAEVAGAWTSMASRIRAFMVKQQESQRALAAIAEEQRVFLRAMHEFACLQGLPEDEQEHPEAPYKVEKPSAGKPFTGIGPDSDVLMSARSFLPPAGDTQPVLLGDLGPPGSGNGNDAGSGSVPDDADHMAAGEAAPDHRRNSFVYDSLDSDNGSVNMIHLSTLRTGPRISNISREMFRQTTLDSLKGRLAPCKIILSRTLMSKWFEPLMSIVILLNAINIGWTIEREIKNQDTYLNNTAEFVFLGIFAAELLLRWIVLGRRCFKVRWNFFDLVLLVVTVISMVLTSALAQHADNEFANIVKEVLILRMMRLLRLVRSVRLTAISRSLWKMAEGLKQCVGTMASALLLMFAFIYVLACFGAEIITKAYANDAGVGSIVANHFSGVPAIMLTLFQFINMDSTAAIYVPLIHRNPGLAIYFLFMVVLVTIALMNLITAVAVDDAIGMTKMDHDMKKQYIRERLKELRPAFKTLFDNLDTSGDGVVKIEEVVGAIEGGLRIPQAIQDIINPGRMLDLFDVLDRDQSGELTETEFVEGLSCVALSDVPLETMQILHLLRTIRREVMSAKKVSRRLHSHFKARASNASSGNRSSSASAPRKPSHF